MQVQTKLRYINHWVDELGRHRYRFRRKGFPGVELPVDGDPSSAEFMASYYAALRGEKLDDAVAAVSSRSGSVADAITRYLESATFHSDYSPSTQGLRRPILKAFLRQGIGNLPLARMDAAYIRRWLETAPTKGAKKTWLLALKPFFRWALEDVELIAADPTLGIKAKATEGDGHHTWTDEEIAQYRTRHPLGTKARLALELLIHFTARVGDGISLGRQHVKDGWVVFTQEKNKRRKPVVVETPMPAAVKAAIEACSSSPDSLTFLANEWGRPYDRRTFNAQFRKWCDEAELPQRCVPHGLRKAGCRIMAESDCSPHEIMSVSGHTTLKEVARYTKAVNRKRLAARAQAKVAAAKEDNVVTFAVAGKR